MGNGSLFDGMGSAKRQFDANYLKAGRYICRIDEAKTFESQQKGPAFKLVMTICHVIDGNNGLGHKVGEQVTWMAMKQPYPNSFLSRIKQAVCTILACADEDVDEAVMERMCGNEQPLAGYLCEVEGRNVPGKPKPGQTEPQMTTRVTFKRAVELAELKPLMPADAVAKVYPKGFPAS